MAVTSGTSGKIYDNATQVGSISQWSMNADMGMEETGALGDVAKKPKPTIYGVSVDISGKYDKADGGQGGLWAKFIAGTAITLDLIESGAHGGSAAGYTGSFYMKSYKVTAKWDGYDEFTGTFDAYGAVAYSTTI